MTLRRQVQFWLVSLAVLCVFLYVFSGVLLPFVAGMAVAYLLDPVCDRLEKMGMGRMWATLTILFAFILILVLFFILLLPLLGNQLALFLDRFPDLVHKLQALLSQYFPADLASVAGISAEDLQSSMSNLIGQGASFVGKLAQSLWSGGQALLSILSLFVITPVVAFYLLLDWDRMVAKVDSLVPRNYVKTVRKISDEMNSTIAGFVRGQGTLCLILGIFYGAGLSLAGLNFGLLIGLFAGLISFIPYVGSTVGLVLSLGVALVQFWPNYWWIGLIVGIFALGQFLEGNILQPKLVGDSVGLHPVWLMFALFAFGLLFGFVGLLVAVPAAATVGVLVRHAIARYLDSELYYGDMRSSDESAAPAAPSEEPQK